MHTVNNMIDLTNLKATDRPHRLENTRLVQGLGHYVHNLHSPDMRHAVFVRSDYAFATLLKVDTSLAQGAPGVIAVLAAQDLDYPVMPDANPLLVNQNPQSFAVLPHDTVQHVGQPIVLIVAETFKQAQAAAALVHIDYEALPETMGKVNPASFVSNYTAGDLSHGLSAMQSDEVSVRTVITWPRVSAMTMEPRACVARWHNKQLTIWLGTQTPSRTQHDLAKALAVSNEHIQVISPDVGGAFGAKSSIYPEEIALALAARKLQTTIRWVASRSEEFVSACHGRGTVLQGQLSVTASGHLCGLSAQIKTELGAWLPYSATVPLRNTTRILPGPYRVDHLNIKGEATLSHTAPVNIFRGAGRPEATLLIETLIERAARAIGADPVEIRRFNLIDADDMPYQTPTGETFDSGDFAATLTLACEKFDYFPQRMEQQRRRQRGEVVGIGVGFYVEPCGQGWESARVTLHDNQKATIASGTPAQGQGHATTFIDLAAHTLGYDAQHIDIELGDTATCPHGVGALASRSMAIGGSALFNACQEARQQLDRGAPFPITINTRFESKETWSNGCVIARVKLDAETGEVKIESIVWADDAGMILNPTLAYDQLIGGAAQGIGQALMEQLRYNDQGQLITGSLMDYAIPRAQDMPPIDIYSLHTASTTNPLGAKGVGEAGCIGIPAAIMNAVRDALYCHLGYEAADLSFPLTSETVWQAMQKKSSE